MKNQCYICLEKGVTYNKNMCYYVNQKNLYLDCSCKLRVHMDCMISWLNINPNCIICHKPLVIYENPVIKCLKKVKCFISFRVFRNLFFIYLIILLQLEINRTREKS
jgi:hypothetical protein